MATSGVVGGYQNISHIGLQSGTSFPLLNKLEDYLCNLSDPILFLEITNRLLKVANGEEGIVSSLPEEICHLLEQFDFQTNKDHLRFLIETKLRTSSKHPAFFTNLESLIQGDLQANNNIASYISSLSEDQQSLFVQTYRYKPQFQLVIRLLAGCIWRNSNNNPKAMEKFFESLHSGHTDLAKSDQTELVLSCLNECRHQELEKIIWEKYEIENFVNYVAKHPTTRACLNRLIGVSERVLWPVLQLIQKENDAELSCWLFPILGENFKKEYLTDDFFAFMISFLQNEKWEMRAGPVYILGKISIKEKHIDQICNILQLVLREEHFVVLQVFWETCKKLIENTAEKTSIHRIVDLLLTISKQQDPIPRRNATVALGLLAPYTEKETFSQIFHLLRTNLHVEDKEISANAAYALMEMAPHVEEKDIPQILNCFPTVFSHNTRGTTSTAYSEMVKKFGMRIKDLPSILNFLQILLSHEDFYYASVFVQSALSSIEANISPIIEFLQTALRNKDSNDDTRRTAGYVFEKIAEYAAEKALPHILNWVRTASHDKDPLVRRSAVLCFQQIIKKIKGEFLDLIQLFLNDEDDAVRQHTIDCLKASISHETKEKIPQVLPYLETALQDKDYYVRRRTVEALEKIAEYAEEKELLQIAGWLEIVLCGAEDVEPFIVNTFANAFGKVTALIEKKGHARILSSLQTVVGNENNNMRQGIVKSLEYGVELLGKKDLPQVLDWLKPTMYDENNYVRESGIKILGKIIGRLEKKEFVQVLSWIETALVDKTFDICCAASEILIKIAEHVQENTISQVLVLIQLALKNDESTINVRVNGGTALEKIAATAREDDLFQVLDFLPKAFQYEDANVSLSAIAALEKTALSLKEKALPQILNLIQLARDADDKNDSLEGAGHSVANTILKSIKMEHLIEVITSQNPIYSIQMRNTIFQHFVNQSIPIYLTENNPNEWLLQIGDIYSQKIDSAKKDLLINRMKNVPLDPILIL